MGRIQASPGNCPTLAIFGGTLARPEHVEFARALGAVLGSDTTLRIYVTDFKGVELASGEPLLSFGFSVAEGLAGVLPPDALAERAGTAVITRRESRRKATFATGTILHPAGKTEELRRLAVLSMAHVICLAAGTKGTTQLFHAAQGFRIPVLPIPYLAGAARSLWFGHVQSIAHQFKLTEEEVNGWARLRVEGMTPATMKQAARAVVNCLCRPLRKRTLVLMPFADHFDWVFNRIIRPAAANASYDVIRLDLHHYTGDIAERFRHELMLCDCVIAVVTGSNANVLYEIGFAHAIGKKVLLLAQQEVSTGRQDEMPFYVRGHRTLSYSSMHDEDGIDFAAKALTGELIGLR